MCSLLKIWNYLQNASKHVNGWFVVVQIGNWLLFRYRDTSSIFLSSTKWIKLPFVPNALFILERDTFHCSPSSFFVFGSIWKNIFWFGSHVFFWWVNMEKNESHSPCHILNLPLKKSFWLIPGTTGWMWSQKMKWRPLDLFWS